LSKNAGTARALVNAVLGQPAGRDTLVRMFITDKQGDSPGARARRLTRLVLDAGMGVDLINALLYAKGGTGLQVFTQIMTSPCVFGMTEEVMAGPQGDDQLASLLTVMMQSGTGMKLLRAIFNSKQMIPLTALVSGAKLENEFGDVVVAKASDPKRGNERVRRLLGIVLQHNPGNQPRLVADVVAGFLGENSRSFPQPGAEQLAPWLLQPLVDEEVPPEELLMFLDGLAEPADPRAGEMLPDLLVALVATTEGQQQIRPTLRKLGETGFRKTLGRITGLLRKTAPKAFVEGREDNQCLERRLGAITRAARVLVRGRPDVGIT